jgi:hypothetical protein
MTTEGSTSRRKPHSARRFVLGIVGTLLVAAIAATIALVIDNVAISLTCDTPATRAKFTFSKVSWANVDPAHPHPTYSDVQADAVRACQMLMATTMQETVVNREVYALRRAGVTCGTIRDSNSSKQWHFLPGANGLAFGEGPLPSTAAGRNCRHTTTALPAATQFHGVACTGPRGALTVNLAGVGESPASCRSVGLRPAS